MKIIYTDTSDEKRLHDVLICSEVGPLYGELIAGILNSRARNRGNQVYKLVPDDYKLHAQDS